MTHNVYFPSLPAVMRHIRDTPKVWTCSDAADYDGGMSWDMNLGFKGALDMANTGWSEGGRDMRVTFDRLPRERGKAMTFRHNPEKGRFQVGRYVTGNPNCFKAPRRSPEDARKHGKVIRLAVNTATQAGSRAQCFANYGAAIAAAVEALELDGYRVEVSAHCACDYPGGRGVYGWTVKGAGDRLDMAALAFSIAHPASLRRIGLALMERFPKNYQTPAYGYPKDIRRDDIPNAPRNTIVLNGSRAVNQCAATPSAAVEHVEAEIEKAMTAWRAGE